MAANNTTLLRGIGLKGPALPVYPIRPQSDPGSSQHGTLMGIIEPGKMVPGHRPLGRKASCSEIARKAALGAVGQAEGAEAVKRKRKQ
jgi:hypothetical protein